MTAMVVKNMSFKVGQTMTITGVPKPDATQFTVNIGPNGKDITMHINARFNAHGDERAMVCNSFQEDKWCEEHREGGFPFNHGEEFKFTIKFNPEEFLIGLSDGSEIHFPNRMGAEKYQHFTFSGEVRIKGIDIQ